MLYLYFRIYSNFVPIYLSINCTGSPLSDRNVISESNFKSSRGIITFTLKFRRTVERMTFSSIMANFCPIQFLCPVQSLFANQCLRMLWGHLGTFCRIGEGGIYTTWTDGGDSNMHFIRKLIPIFVCKYVPAEKGMYSNASYDSNPGRKRSGLNSSGFLNTSASL